MAHWKKGVWSTNIMMNTSYIRHLHITLAKKESDMLFAKNTNQVVSINPKKELSDHMKRILDEKLIPETHKGHPFFSIEERARVTS